MIHTLDKYQQEALLQIKNSDLVLIQGKRYSGKSYLVRYYVNELWSSGLKSLIVVPDKEYAKMYIKHLGAFGLADFAFIFEKSFLQSDYFKSKINYLLNEENIPVSKKNILIKKLIYSNRLNKVNNYYSLLNTKLLNNKSLTELFIINAFDKRAFENIYFNQIIDPDKFEFNQQEYNELKANIKTAFELQLQGKKTTDKYFTPNNYKLNNSEKAWENIKNWIHESRIQTLDSIQVISKFMQEQSTMQFDKIWQKTETILKDIENLCFEIEKYKILYEDFDDEQLNLFGLDKKYKLKKEEYQLAGQKITIEYKRLIDELSSLSIISQNFKLPNREESDIETIADHINKISKGRKQLEQIILGSIKKELKSMNFRNIKNDAIVPLEEQLKKLFSILNSGYVKEKWEDNAFSINKQLDFLETLLHDLNHLENQKNLFLKHYKWNKFLNSLDVKSLYIINILDTYQPKNWLIFYKNWFIQNIILKYKYYLNSSIDKELEKLLNEDEEYQDIIHKKSLKIWQNKREITLSKHKSEIKDIIDFDFENSDISESTNLNLYSTLLPITIISADSYQNTQNTLEGVFDLTVFEGADAYKNNFVEKYEQLNSKRNIIVLDEEESIKEINKQLLNLNPSLNLGKVVLKGFHQQGMINLVDMNLTERLYAARNIAHLMISGNPNIKIYLMKGIVLFSTFDDILNQVLLKILGRYGIKETKIIDTPFHSLVDNILEFNNKQILLTQNNLLNYKDSSSIIWQLKVLEKIKKSGIKIVNFDIKLLLDNPVKNIKEFVQKNIL